MGKMRIGLTHPCASACAREPPPIFGVLPKFTPTDDNGRLVGGEQPRGEVGGEPALEEVHERQKFMGRERSERPWSQLARSFDPDG
jgi:hypothetical protein